MKTIYLLLLLAVVSGAVLCGQAALNAKLGKAVGDPVYPVLISFVVGTVGALFYSIITKIELSQMEQTCTVGWI